MNVRVSTSLSLVRLSSQPMEFVYICIEIHVHVRCMWCTVRAMGVQVNLLSASQFGLPISYNNLYVCTCTMLSSVDLHDSCTMLTERYSFYKLQYTSICISHVMCTASYTLEHTFACKMYINITQEHDYYTCNVWPLCTLHVCVQ